MATKTDRLIQTGIDHLGRFAFYTRDNPFVSSRAGLGLNREDASSLRLFLMAR